tara:strand:+ start:982 stop:1467 length:486 start_codon:yes stop_codon:yes gene_type:complete
LWSGLLGNGHFDRNDLKHSMGKTDSGIYSIAIQKYRKLEHGRHKNFTHMAIGVDDVSFPVRIYQESVDMGLCMLSFFSKVASEKNAFKIRNSSCTELIFSCVPFDSSHDLEFLKTPHTDDDITLYYDCLRRLGGQFDVSVNSDIVCAADTLIRLRNLVNHL